MTTDPSSDLRIDMNPDSGSPPEARGPNNEGSLCLNALDSSAAAPLPHSKAFSSPVSGDEIPCGHARTTVSANLGSSFSNILELESQPRPMIASGCGEIVPETQMLVFEDAFVPLSLPEAEGIAEDGKQEDEKQEDGKQEDGKQEDEKQEDEKQEDGHENHMEPLCEVAELMIDEGSLGPNTEMERSAAGQPTFSDSETTTTDKNIIYRLLCTDTSKHPPVEIFRYSWKPFDNISSQARDVARANIAPFGFSREVEGVSLQPRKSQQRNTFGSAEDLDREKFEIGVDFRVRGHSPLVLIIHSTYVKEMLQNVILYYPGLYLEGRDISLYDPYKVLFYYWDALQRILDEGRMGSPSVKIVNPETGSESEIICHPVLLDHLAALLTAPHIMEVRSLTVLPERELHSKGLATYDYLWLLFRPGDTVFARSRGNFSGFVVQNISHEQPYAGESLMTDIWKVKVWNLAHSDGKLTRQSSHFYVNRFKGEKEIVDLPIFPIAFMNDDGKTRDSLIDRGKRYHKIICEEPSHMKYRGLVMAGHNKYDFFFRSKDKDFGNANYYEGDIIIDYRRFVQEVGEERMKSLELAGDEPDDGRGHPVFSKFNDMVCSVSNPLEPTQYLLLPEQVFGFAIGSKKWESFDMSCISSISETDDPMRYLIIDEDRRRLLKSAAGQPLQSTALKPWTTEWSADFIEGKGRGRVIFLHGPPGTGKTMTVECISKWTRRPLISLSSADLGFGDVETRLVDLLNEAAMWGAIVLIDEAEVYLEQRQSRDIGRNSLVAAFLRTLEYFPGLLFLTSNAIGLFDEAVMSRIHLSIPYERPMPDQREEIWVRMFEKLERDQEEKEIVAGESTTTSTQPTNSEISIRIKVEEAAKALVYNRDFKIMELNGRDIRNVLLSAIDLARMDAYSNLPQGNTSPNQIQVGKNHLMSVVKNRKEFRDGYKAATHFYPEELAERENLRYNKKSDEEA